MPLRATGRGARARYFLTRAGWRGRTHAAYSSDACRVAGAGLAPRGRFGALRAEHRYAWLLRPFGLRSPTAGSAPKVAASDPRHPTRCGVFRLRRRWGSFCAWHFYAAPCAAGRGLAPSRPRAPAARAGIFGLGGWSIVNYAAKAQPVGGGRATVEQAAAGALRRGRKRARMFEPAISLQAADCRRVRARPPAQSACKGTPKGRSERSPAPAHRLCRFDKLTPHTHRP